MNQHGGNPYGLPTQHTTKPSRNLLKKGQYDHPQEEDYMAHNYTHDPSIFDHLSPSTTKL
jgi:hypothetical protein